MDVYSMAAGRADVREPEGSEQGLEVPKTDRAIGRLDKLGVKFVGLDHHGSTRPVGESLAAAKHPIISETRPSDAIHDPSGA